MKRVLLSVLLMLWLPVQGVLAFSMPFCAHEGTAHSFSGSTAVIEQGESQADMAPCHHAEQTQSQSDTGCDHCPACYLAATPALSSTLRLGFEPPADRLLPDVLNKPLPLIISAFYRPPIV